MRGMNLAFIGFLTAGVVFALYAATFNSLAGQKLPAFLRSYATAYYSLALAFLFFALGSVNPQYLETAVLVGNLLLLVGSICLLNVLLHKNKLKAWVLGLGVLLSVLFLWLRLTTYPPMPFIESGVLVFNTQRVIAIIIGLIFLTVWLPASLLVSRMVTVSIRFTGVKYAFTFLYGVSVIAAILFISFKTVPMVTLSFVTLIICFAILVYSNYVLTKLLSEKL